MEYICYLKKKTSKHAGIENIYDDHTTMESCQDNDTYYYFLFFHFLTFSIKGKHI